MTTTETFRPGDRVYVYHQCGRLPVVLVGEHGRIVTMNYGRGRNRAKLYARVQFDHFTEPRRVPLHALARCSHREKP